MIDSQVNSMGNTVINYANKSIEKTKEYYNIGTTALLMDPKWFAFTCLIELVIMWLLFYKWNPFDITGKFPAAVSLVFLINIFINLMLYVFVDDRAFFKSKGITVEANMSDMLSKVGMTTLVILATILIMWTLIKISEYTPIFSGLTWLAGVLTWTWTGVFILALMRLLIWPSIKQSIDGAKKHGAKSIFSLFGSLIMYLPCALIDLIDWFKNQYKITTSSTWILLGMEVLFLGLTFIVPRIFSWIITSDGKHLLKDPVYLDKATTIGTYKDLYKNKKQTSEQDKSNTPEKEQQKYDYNYSISAWFWINPQPPNTSPAYTKYTNILEYGDKPIVEYNSLENSLRVRCKINNNNYITIFETNDVKYQTWNNIVINYDGGNMDVFLNSELVGSKPNIAPFMSYENIVVGEKNGIEGGIANVVYYNKILGSEQIKLTYKTLKNKPTPLL